MLQLREILKRMEKEAVTMVTEEQIRSLAYSIWEQEGRPHGKDIEHYFRAKQILEEQEAAHIIELAPPPTPKQIDLPVPPDKRSIRSRRKKK